MMKKILVAVADYPNNEGNTSMMFVHIRNKYYIQHGIEVTVLNFKAENEYIFDGIQVISRTEYKKTNIPYDVLVMHAPNIRNHYRFLICNEKFFTRILFFFHGHEILKINEVYPKPYYYLKEKNRARKAIQGMYDNYKLYLWRRYFPKIAFKSDFVFVSHSLFSEFKKYVKLSEANLLNHVHIINNSVGHIFETEQYSSTGTKDYDFITIRSDIDSSVYCVDLVCKLAERFPNKNFLLIGKGRWFQHNNKPLNITWIDQKLSHGDLIRCVDNSRYALMLTRRDTQGVMACELATYGIPLITSDLKVCKEMFQDFENVQMCSNDFNKLNLDKICSRLEQNRTNRKNDKFGYYNTVFREELLIKQIKENESDYR